MSNSLCVKDYSLLDRASPPVLAKHCKIKLKEEMMVTYGNLKNFQTMFTDG